MHFNLPESELLSPVPCGFEGWSDYITVGSSVIAFALCTRSKPITLCDRQHLKSFPETALQLQNPIRKA
ncbi:hypothetical protein PSAC2689_20311 [Paraburkholderia sacchari]